MYLTSIAPNHNVPLVHTQQQQKYIPIYGSNRHADLVLYSTYAQIMKCAAHWLVTVVAKVINFPTIM